MDASTKTVKVFKYISSLDVFVVNEDYKKIADRLALTEWNPVAWIGRLFTLDNGYGGDWLENWPERDVIAADLKRLGYDYLEARIINSNFFQNGVDGPCHSDVQRKRFWTDVLKSLALSLDTLFHEARETAELTIPGDSNRSKAGRKAYITRQINEIKREYNITD